MTQHPTSNQAGLPKQGNASKNSKGGVLRLIAVFKLFKATLLILLGVGILKLAHNDPASLLDQWAATLRIDSGNRFIGHAIEKAANLPPHRMRDLGMVSFVYAALFLTEGIGLWMMKRWAEWFTVAITTSLVPLEVYELIKHATPTKAIVLVINVAVIVYLVLHIRKEAAENS